MTGPLSEDVRALAEAIVEVLVPPLAARTADDRAAAEVQRNRAIRVATHLEVLLEGACDSAVAARLIRRVAESEPVTYTPHKPKGSTP